MNTRLSTDPTDEGKRLINEWLAANDALATASSIVKRAEENLNAARVELAKWMLPGDANIGEKFCIWYGDSLISVTHYTTPQIDVRSRGKRGLR